MAPVTSCDPPIHRSSPRVSLRGSPGAGSPGHWRALSVVRLFGRHPRQQVRLGHPNVAFGYLAPVDTPCSPYSAGRSSAVTNAASMRKVLPNLRRRNAVYFHTFSLDRCVAMLEALFVRRPYFPAFGCRCLSGHRRVDASERSTSVNDSATDCGMSSLPSIFLIPAASARDPPCDGYTPERDIEVDFRAWCGVFVGVVQRRPRMVSVRRAIRVVSRSVMLRRFDMNTLSRIRRFAFLVILVGGLLPAALPSPALASTPPCPDDSCGGCGPAGFYWQNYDGYCFQCSGCQSAGDCVYDHGGYKLCWCPAC